MGYKHDFLQFAMDMEVLCFGEFTLKSGRVSPYFFNAGLFNTGMAAARMGQFYAQAIADSGISFDVLFGPAYKGIPLAVVTAAELATEHDMDKGFAFNRKEAKDHGEGGNIVGASLAGKKILIIDDVISAGTSVRESVDIIKNHNANLVGVVVSLDRQERGQGDKSAVEEVEANLNVTVVSIANLADLIEFVGSNDAMADTVAAIKSYREKYGV